MPLSKKGRKVKAAMKKTYGTAKGERVFHKSVNAKKVKGAKRKPRKRRR